MAITNLNDLQDKAISMIDDVLNNKINSEKVEMFCQLCGVVLSTLKIQIDYIKATQKFEQIAFIEDEKKLLGNKA